MERIAALVIAMLLAAEAPATQDVPYFGQGVAVVGTLGVLFVLWRFQRSIIAPLEHRADIGDRRLRTESRQRRECEWRFAELVQWMRTDGLAVPDRILYGRPPWEGEEGHE